VPTGRKQRFAVGFAPRHDIFKREFIGWRHVSRVIYSVHVPQAMPETSADYEDDSNGRNETFATLDFHNVSIAPPSIR